MTADQAVRIRLRRGNEPATRAQRLSRKLRDMVVYVESYGMGVPGFGTPLWLVVEDRSSHAALYEVWAGRNALKAEILWEDMQADTRVLAEEAFHEKWRAEGAWVPFT